MENGLLIYGLISFSVIELIEVIRMVFGPLNQSICWFQMFWRNGPVQGAILELDAIIIFRVNCPLKQNLSLILNLVFLLISNLTNGLRSPQ